MTQENCKNIFLKSIDLIKIREINSLQVELYMSDIC